MDCDRSFSIVKAGYDQLAARYASEREKFDNWSELNEFSSKLKPQARILDVGCGTGIPIARHLVNSGFEVVGIDLSPEMIATAKKNLPETSFLEMNMTHLDFPAESFDGLISCYAIFHVPREVHETVFRSFYEILRSRAPMLLSVGASEWEEVDDYLGVDMFWSHYAPTRTESLISGVGFEVESGRTIKNAGERHHWILARKP